ncbi:MAG: alpha-amylase family glycosyl hydrolase, partial [Leptospiraceae bacterium]|nr:alpha-amylase family glycosyl hydrolase [Leptospiraceae bacterium]
GSAWEWDEKTEAYYYHAFTVQQPDLNWRNPEVKKAIFKMIQFWLDLGVDGFRLDVVNYYFKDAEFRNNPRNFFKGLREYERQYHIYDRNRPETHEVLKEFRKLLDSYPGDRMSVGEVFQEPPGTAELPASFCGNNDELHMAFNFSFLYTKWDPIKFAKVIEEQEKAMGDVIWPNYTLSNHDQPRHFSRYKKRKSGVQRAKVAAAMLLTLRGTPFLYYGEEIGMESEWIPKKYIQDPLGKRYWPLFVGRDRARQPMCWTDEVYAGFSRVEPWLPVSKNKDLINVARQEKDPTSLLSFYKALIRLRKKEIALRRGSLRLTIKENPYILGYERIHDNEKILILLNFSDRERRFSPPPSLSPRGKVLLSTHRAESVNYNLDIIQLYPYEVNILKIE